MSKLLYDKLDHPSNHICKMSSKSLRFHLFTTRPSITYISAGAAGLTQFRNGIKTVDEAEEKFSKLKDDVVAYLR